jgi:hypothetical protein
MNTRRLTVRLWHGLACLLLPLLAHAATFIVVSDMQITTNVHAGTTTGPLNTSKPGSADVLTQTFTISLPNLTPYQPSGWPDKIVVSKVTGTSTDSSPIYTTDTLYVDWAVINNGAAPALVQFFSRLYVDGVEQHSWITDPPLNVDFYSYVQDFPIRSLSAGQHTIKLVTDVDGVIAEGNEADNEYTKTINVVAHPTPSDFIQALPVPEGVATDADGNVFVIHDDGNIFTNYIVLTKFSPSGAAVRSILLGTFFDGIDGMPRLSFNPNNGRILALFSNGKLKEITPATMDVQDILDLRNTGTFSFTPGAAYATTGSTRLQNFNVFPSTVLTFGDVAAFASGGGTVDLFATATQTDIASI